MSCHAGALDFHTCTYIPPCQGDVSRIYKCLLCAQDVQLVQGNRFMHADPHWQVACGAYENEQSSHGCQLLARAAKLALVQVLTIKPGPGSLVLEINANCQESACHQPAREGDFAFFIDESDRVYMDYCNCDVVIVSATGHHLCMLNMARRKCRRMRAVELDPTEVLDKTHALLLKKQRLNGTLSLTNIMSGLRCTTCSSFSKRSALFFNGSCGIAI